MPREASGIMHPGESIAGRDAPRSNGGNVMSFESRNGRRRVGVCLVWIAVSVLALSQPAMAADTNTSTGEAAGLGIASALSTLVYGPVKIVYATLGSVIGGIAWGLSGGDADVLEAVLMPAVRGDYVVTPSHLRGEEPLEFIGHRRGYGYSAPVQTEVQEDF